MTEEEHPIEFLPELALGVLAEEDAPGIREHLAGCPSCRADYDVMAEASRLLPYAVEGQEPSADLRGGLMDRIAAEPRVLRPRQTQPAWQRFAAIAAAAAVFIAAGGFAGAALRGGSDGDLKEENSRQASLVQAMAEGNARRDTAEDGAMKASLVYAPGQDSAFALVEGLPTLPAGKAYQAWFIADGAPKPSNVFSASAGGVWLESPGDVVEFAAMALTIEDKGGADEPSQAQFMVLDLKGAASANGGFSLREWFALSAAD